MNLLLHHLVSFQVFLSETTPEPLSISNGAKASKSADSVNCLFGKANAAGDCVGGNGGIFGTISNILIYLVGAISVLMLIYGGLRYVTSTGDSARVKGAKDTIVYAIIGIVVALLAYAIVGFVTANIKN